MTWTTPTLINTPVALEASGYTSGEPAPPAGKADEEQEVHASPPAR
jgi:hypothetical protein